MNNIFKYKIERDLWQITMPKGAKILTAKEQRNNICIWAEVDTEQHEAEIRTFEVFGTGHEIPPAKRNYIGTVIFEGVNLVLHVYERVNS